MKFLQTTGVAILLTLLAGAAAWADTITGTTVVSQNPANPVPLGAGTDVQLTSTTTAPPHSPTPPTTAALISAGKVTFQYATDGGGNPVPEASVVTWVSLNSPGQNPIAGQTTLDVDLDALGFVSGTTGGFRAHYVTGGGAHKVDTHFSQPIDITATGGDPFPDGTITYTQGFYGASPIGEVVVPLLIDQATCEDILDALTGIAGVPATDCSNPGDRADLALFLTGDPATAEGQEDPQGFLPSGFEPGQNFAAQTVTLLLNLNLGVALDVDEFPIMEDYAINIDPVTDVPSGITYDPVFINQDELADFCADLDVNQICDAGTLVLSDLGDLVAALDEATGGVLPEGTTVGEILDAALTFLTGGDPNPFMGETVTEGDLTAIIGLINESYDEGVINGFVTAFDAD